MHIAMSPFLPSKILRRVIMRFCGVEIPKSSYVGAGTVIGSNLIRIGEHVGVNIRSHLDGAASITLENYVRLGSSVTILTGTHDIEDNVIRRDLTKPTIPRPVKICRGTWLGANVVVLPGITIGEGCVVAAGSVVTRDLNPNALYAGVPATKVRDLPVSTV